MLKPSCIQQPVIRNTFSQRQGREKLTKPDHLGRILWGIVIVALTGTCIMFTLAVINANDRVAQELLNQCQGVVTRQVSSSFWGVGVAGACNEDKRFTLEPMKKQKKTT